MVWFFVTLLAFTDVSPSAVEQPTGTTVFQMQPELADNDNLLPLLKAFQAAPSTTNRLQLASAYLQRARHPGWSSYFHDAEALLANFQAEPQHREHLILLQADILQQQHQFTAALALLEPLLSATPHQLQANLMAARIHLALGDTIGAQRACNRLMREALFFFATCSYEVTGRKGQWSAAYSGLKALLQQNPDLPAELAIWTRGILAEQAEQLGQLDAAVAWLEPILTEAPTSLWLKWADLKLAIKQPEAVYQRLVTLAADAELEDSLLLRLALAEQELGHPSHFGHQLQQQMQVRILRQDQEHAADLAHYFLRVSPDPQAALQWATINYNSAREPDDLALLTQSRHAVALLNGGSK